MRMCGNIKSIVLYSNKRDNSVSCLIISECFYIVSDNLNGVEHDQFHGFEVKDLDIVFDGGKC